jgi:hypothetical protein
MTARIIQIDTFWYAEIHLTGDFSLEQVIYMLGAYQTQEQAQSISDLWLQARNET